jgi:Tfp pilus assembly protein PilW
METRQSLAPAFTLVEVLVSTAVLMLLVVIMAQMTRSVAASWTAGSGNSERRQNVRALADFIGQELRSATLSVDPSAPPPNLQFVLNPASVTARYPSAIFWQAPVATDSSAGDLAEVGYFVRWTTSGTVPRAQLCRFFVSQGDPNYLVDTATAWVSDALLQTVAPADPASGYVGLFADNVIGFWARCLRCLPDGTETEIAAANAQYDSRVTHKLPSTVEISLVLIDGSSASRMTETLKSQLIAHSSTAVNAADFLKKIQADPSLKSMSQGARAYTTRIFLENSR